MSVKITDQMGENHPTQVKLGQYYKDTTNDAVYIVAKIGNYFALVDVESGSYYSDVAKIEDIFDTDRKDFVLVPNVEIILS